MLAQGKDIIPIPGTKKEKYLVENVGALDVRITEEDKAIRKAIEEAEVRGARYPEPMAGLCLLIRLKWSNCRPWSVL